MQFRSFLADFRFSRTVDSSSIAENLYARLHTSRNSCLDAFSRRSHTALYEPENTGFGDEQVVGHERFARLTGECLCGAVAGLETRSVVESAEGLAVLHACWTLHTAGPTAHGVSTKWSRQPDGTWLFVIDDPHAEVPHSIFPA